MKDNKRKLFFGISPIILFVLYGIVKLWSSGVLGNKKSENVLLDSLSVLVLCGVFVIFALEKYKVNRRQYIFYMVVAICIFIMGVVFLII